MVWVHNECILTSTHNVCTTQIYTRDPRTCTIFVPAWGSIWGSLGFLAIKMTAVRQVRMSLHLLLSEHEDKTHVKMPYGTKIMNALVCFSFAARLAKT